MKFDSTEQMQAVTSGPGILLTWPPVATAESFVVQAARDPSPSFYDLDSSCCPRLNLPNPVSIPQPLPCCPVAASATSLQVEGLDPGVRYTFRLIAIHANASNTTITSLPARVPSAPSEPGAIEVHEESAAIVSLAWAAPAFDGGTPVVGYRLWGDCPGGRSVGHVPEDPQGHCLGPVSRLLLANSSDAAAAWRPLVLLPTTRYELAVQPLNLAGVGPASLPTSFTTSAPPAAAFELQVGVWGRGWLARGGRARHRFFVPPGSEWAQLHVQQAGSDDLDRAPARDRERNADALDARLLHLYLRRDEEPPLPAEAAAPTPGLLANTSAWGGGLTLAVDQPASGWWYVLVHAAAARARIDYDARVALDSTRDLPAGSSHQRQTWPAPATDAQARAFAYAVYPAGRTQFSDWAVAKYVHPASPAAGL